MDAISAKIPSSDAPEGGSAPDIGRTRLFAMAAATGIAVANIYYNQPMLGIIKAEFAGESIAAMIPTATQLGYALGLFFLVPLGDLTNRRNLITGQFVALAAVLALAAAAPAAWALAAASVLVGACATVAQQIVPFAATLAAPEKRGAAVGTVMSGLLTGVLLSRTVSGFVGEHFGWREMFWFGIPLALAAAAAMRAILPDHRASSPLPYHRAMWSLTHYWRAEPALRAAVGVQAAVFGSFVAFWTILALLLATPTFDLGADAAGLFGVLGVVGVLATPIAGRMADRRGPGMMVWFGVAVLVASWAMVGAWVSLPALIIGVITLDLGMHAVLVANQSVIYALDPAARSRLNTIFMTGMFLGGSAGSALATFAWAEGGWTAVSALGTGLALVALVIKLFASRRSTGVA